MSEVLLCVGTYEKQLFCFKFALSEEEKEESVEDHEEGNSNRFFQFSANFGPIKHLGSINAIDISGKYLAAGGSDELLRIYDLNHRREVGICNGHTSTITSINISGNANPPSMISADQTGQLIFWQSEKNATNWIISKTIKPHPTNISQLNIHPSGRLAFAVSTIDKSFALINLLTGKVAYRTKPSQHRDGLQCVCWSPSGQRFSTAEGQNINIFDLNITDTPIAVAQIEFKAISMSYAEERIILCGSDNGMWCAIVINENDQRKELNLINNDALINQKKIECIEKENQQEEQNEKQKNNRKRRRLNEDSDDDQSNQSLNEFQNSEDEDEEEEEQDNVDISDISQNLDQKKENENIQNILPVIIQHLPTLSSRIKVICTSLMQLDQDIQPLNQIPVAFCACSDGSISAWRIDVDEFLSLSHPVIINTNSSSSNDNFQFISHLASIKLPNVRITCCTTNGQINNWRPDPDSEISKKQEQKHKFDDKSDIKQIKHKSLISQPQQQILKKKTQPGNKKEKKNKRDKLLNNEKIGFEIVPNKPIKRKRDDNIDENENDSELLNISRVSINQSSKPEKKRSRGKKKFSFTETSSKSTQNHP